MSVLTHSISAQCVLFAWCSWPGFAEEIAPDDAEVRRALSDPAVVRAMQDPMVQHCLNVCRTEPHRLPEFAANPRVRRHLDVLQRAGVVRFQ
jgi:hypothetical protein